MAVDIAVGDHFPVLLSYQTNSILVGPFLSSCCALGTFNSRKRIPVNRAYKSWGVIIRNANMNSDKNLKIH